MVGPIQDSDVCVCVCVCLQGWDTGLRNMCIGEHRKLTIPSDLAYGERGAGAKIPGGATLVFEVELVDIDRPKEDL